MKTTPFTHFHEELGARMAPFAGYNMPIEYTGIKDEHNTVREKVGVFDVSHMGEFWVKGPKAFELVQKLTSNDVAALSDGKVQYSCFPNETGGIVDDLLVYRFSAEKYLLVVNAANIDKDWAWCTKWAKELGMTVEMVQEIKGKGNISQYVSEGRRITILSYGGVESNLFATIVAPVNKYTFVNGRLTEYSTNEGQRTVIWN